MRNLYTFLDPLQCTDFQLLVYTQYHVLAAEQVICKIIIKWAA